MRRIDFLMAIEVAISTIKKRWIIPYGSGSVTIVLRIWCGGRGAGVCKGHFWLVNGFLWHNICDVIDITQCSLGLFTKGRTQESALLDEWVWWVHSRAFGYVGVE